MTSRFDQHRANSPQPAGALARPQPLGDVVYETILQKLLTLEIKPEDRISVDELARRLGVSQTPIREALTRLEAQGLVGKTHLIGYRAVSQLSKADFDQLYEARVLLEPHVAARAASTISDDELDRLDRILEELASGRIHDDNRLVLTVRADLEFHRTIAAACGNRVIARMLDTLHAQVQFTLLRRRVEPINASPANAEHRLILAALRRRDADSAARLMREHLAASRERYWPHVDK